ncbi:MAG TPA: amidohydrolase family protein [Terriglobales bacterium]|nr:amidohydrolase family protein [Terriglobales bacterium]
MILKTAACLLSAFCSMLSAQTQPLPAQPSKTPADKIFLHGDIYTGVSGTSSFHETQRAEAIAVSGDRIQAIGKQSDILKLKGPTTEVIDLGGHFVMPGFNDAHLHLALAGFEKLNVNLVGVQTLDEMRDRVRARVATATPGEWIVGEGWDETLWPVKELPSRWDIDEVTTDHPVFLQRVDGHVALVNTRALQMAGITLATKDPMGGEIVRDMSGAPTGILRETARTAVTALIPEPTQEKRKQALEAALADLAQWGITSAQDNSSWEDFLTYEELEREGKLTARISEWLAFDDPIETLKSHRAAHSSVDNMLHTGMLKGFMDGSLGSHTAAMLQPYTDDPNNSGLPRYEQAKLTQMTKERVDAGFQIGFHAIGDKGVQMALDAFTEAEKDARDKKIKGPSGGDDFRLRIEHAQITNPSQIAQFKKLNVIASMQPSHLLTDMNWAVARLGKQRAQYSYAWAEFLNHGVTLAFGTDYPVEPVTPFRGLYSAVTRKSENGRKEYFPEQKISIDQAIAAYTTGSAFAEFAEKYKGTLAVGKLADFVLLDRDVTSIEPVKILGTKVLQTVVGGKTVYSSQ